MHTVLVALFGRGTWGFHVTLLTDRECPPSIVEWRVKFRREYTLTVLSEVAVARSGRPFGLGTEAQAREDADGLNSARALICTEREAIVVVWSCMRW
jgi:hypothetical protein